MNQCLWGIIAVFLSRKRASHLSNITAAHKRRGLYISSIHSYSTLPTRRGREEQPESRGIETLSFNLYTEKRCKISNEPTAESQGIPFITYFFLCPNIFPPAVLVDGPALCWISSVRPVLYSTWAAWSPARQQRPTKITALALPCAFTFSPQGQFITLGSKSYPCMFPKNYSLTVRENRAGTETALAWNTGRTEGL